MFRQGFRSGIVMKTVPSKCGKKAVTVLVPLVIAGAGMLILIGPRVHAALVAIIHPPGRNILVSRSLAPEDISAVSSGNAITITVDVTNDEEVALRGFYYSDQVPSGWAVYTSDVSVNGSSITDYSYEQGSAGEIYTGCTPSRWALETPQGEGVFSPIHSIAASGGTARIVYTMIVTGGTGSDYSLGHDAWAGWLETSTGTAVFGYQDITGTLSADFTAQPRLGPAPLSVQFTDLSTGDVLTRSWDFGDGGTASLPGPTHTYSALGTYTVSLTVHDSSGSDELVRPRYIHVTDVVYEVYLPVIVK